MPPASLTPVEEQASTRILELLFRFRRLAAADPCGGQPCDLCFQAHRPKLLHYLSAGEPVHFVLPAFPAKSPNPNKVLGALPDLAEGLALDFLQSFCEYVSHVYPPGARITICSDGHVFGDLVGVSDVAVSDYRAELERLITQGGRAAVDMYGLEDAYGQRDYTRLRQRLEDEYAMSLAELRYWVRQDARWRALFNGIHRFVVEDQFAIRSDTSKSALRRECKDLAYQVVRRSNAWGALVAEKFPAALRLSIHPQPAHAEKIGFHMVRTRDNWLTPWHSVVLDTGTSRILVKRFEAEQLNASLIWRDGRPSHFVAV